MANKELTINQIKEKYKTNKVYKWRFSHFSVPVYVVYKGQKIIVLDYRRHAYPVWITADALVTVTEDRFHAIKGMKYIVGDARKAEVLATFDRPVWPTIKMWKEHLGSNWDEQPAAQKFIMSNLTRWFDEKARGIKKAARFKSVEDVFKFVVQDIFEGEHNWQRY